VAEKELDLLVAENPALAGLLSQSETERLDWLRELVRTARLGGLGPQVFVSTRLSTLYPQHAVAHALYYALLMPSPAARLFHRDLTSRSIISRGRLGAGPLPDLDLHRIAADWMHKPPLRVEAETEDQDDAHLDELVAACVEASQAIAATRVAVKDACDVMDKLGGDRGVD